MNETALKMEAARTSETLVNFYQTIPMYSQPIIMTFPKTPAIGRKTITDD
jgi:hypothetical protein